uniref:Uncharacterized protein n=1 Tax=Knipowitschia caucasica TaxID=637954 RepID=A0AAV2LHQ0_KNICA
MWTWQRLRQFRWMSASASAQSSVKPKRISETPRYDIGLTVSDLAPGSSNTPARGQPYPSPLLGDLGMN